MPKKPTDPATDLDVVLIGKATALFRVSTLSYVLSITKSAAIKYLRSLRVPIQYIGKHGYFLIHELDKAMFTRGRVGERDYAAPGSDYKNKNQHRRKNTPALTEVDDAFVTLANSVEVRHEMEIASKRRGDVAVNVVQQLMRLTRKEEKRDKRDRDTVAGGVGQGTDGASEGGGSPSPVGTADVRIPNPTG